MSAQFLVFGLLYFVVQAFYLNSRAKYGKKEPNKKKRLIATTKNLFLNSLFLNFLKNVIIKSLNKFSYQILHYPLF